MLNKLQNLLRVVSQGIIVGNNDNAYTIPTSDIKLYGELNDVVNGDVEYYGYLTKIAGIEVYINCTVVGDSLVQIVVVIENDLTDETLHVSYGTSQIIIG